MTVKSRIKHYPARIKVNAFVDRDGRHRQSDDPGGQGVELVRQIKVCPDCAESSVNHSHLPDKLSRLR
ncbi:hypothetical protein [Pleionea sp. CnH1-48]|uniref:hypothetical protein n=1 Tax=Pleionea sp. CnH1-48 TaxID=2954494 RepID=UPI002096D8D9|nr:hypothetical protein [Pleionea sp. CnH1-48]MCO7222929.1 hypothetical protein [Pleionea sp. CnH1-48]